MMPQHIDTLKNKQTFQTEEMLSSMHNALAVSPDSLQGLLHFWIEA